MDDEPPAVALLVACTACGHMAPHLQRCVRCKHAFYCDRACQSRDWPRHKAHCTAAVAAASSSVAEKVCRYCLDEPSPEHPVLAPCACRGDQQYVHLDCLRRWQRSVIVSQPTHPAFYEDDPRQRKCQVCLQPFSVSPLSRGAMMASFNGPELAALIAVGNLLVCSAETSAAMQANIDAHPGPLARNLQHWAASAYLVLEVEAHGAARGPHDDDGVMAVCLTRPLAADAGATLAAALARALPDLFAPALAHLTLRHFTGGPVSEGIPLAVARLPQPPAQRSDRLKPLRTEAEADGGATWVYGFVLDVAREVARQQPDGTTPAPVLQVYWGHAGWTRVQLLGEMARGTWGLCAAEASDIFETCSADPATLHAALLAAGRPAFAAKSEMTRHDV